MPICSMLGVMPEEQKKLLEIRKLAKLDTIKEKEVKKNSGGGFFSNIFGK